MDFLRMLDQNLSSKRVLIREDLNVPLRDGVISNDARLRAALPTLRLALDAGARVMVMSHLGRPKEGEYQQALSLQPIANYLSSALGHNVRLIRNPLTDDVSVEPGQLVLFENIRFLSGESKSDEKLAKALARLCDVFVMDAFGTAHRAQASTYGVAKYAPLACAGPLLVKELEALSKATENPQSPVLAIVGGAKVSTKIGLLESLSHKVDRLIVGGGIANTFLLAAGKPVGKSLVERDEVDLADRLMSNVEIPLPVDVVVAKEFSATANGVTKSVDDVADDEMILDIGPDTRQRVAQIIASSGTIIWNGPVGVFEFQSFCHGTRSLSEAIAGSSAFSLAGGGDTLAAIDQFGVSDQIDYISTGGGAFLEFLEGRTLPAVDVLTV